MSRKGREICLAVSRQLGMGFWLGLFIISPYASAIPSSLDAPLTTLPLTCSELLPDTTPYILFFESVGRSQVVSDRRFSKRIYRVLSLRDRMLDAVDKGKDQNPIDTLIRKTLCFYREQKEPLKPIGSDDPQFLSYIKSSFKDLESKVEEALFQWELERQQRREFERMALRNQRVVESLIREADVEADQTFEKLTRRAKQKVRTQ